MRSNSTTAEVMFSKIRQWKSSGMSQKSFCRQHGIAYHSFHHYYKKIRDADQNSSTGFIPLQVSDPDTSIFALLSFSNGNTVQFHQAVSPDYLKALVG